MSALNPISEGFREIPFPFEASESCPTCDQLVPLEKLALVKGRLAARDRHVSGELTTRLQQQFARTREEDQSSAQRALAQVRHEGAEALERVRAEGVEKEAAAREEARRQSDVLLQSKLAEQAQAFEESQGTLREQLAGAEQTSLQLTQAITESAAELATVKAQALEAETRLRADLSTEYESALSERTAQLTQAHTTALKESQDALREQLASAEQTRLQMTQVIADNAAELAAVKAQALEAETRLRADLSTEYESAMNERTAQLAQAHTTALQQAAEASAETLAGRLLELEQTRAKLAQSEQTAQSLLDAAKREHEEREQVTRSQLEQTLARVGTAEAAQLASQQQLQALKDGHAAEVTRVVQETREALEHDKTTAVHAEQAKRLEETQKLSVKLEDLQRQLERKTAEELGEGAELELYEELKGRFEGDLIRRVPNGVSGADIIQEVRENGVVCGKLVYDSKNRKDWKTEYATKLRNDQLAERADHAILSTNKFPAGTKQLHVHEHVIVACPARVAAVAQILREQVVQMHMLRVSNEAREEKTHELYAFMTSPRCGQLFDAVNAQITRLEEIDAAELKAHQATWDRRGKAVKSLEKAHGDLRFEVNRIVGVLDIDVEGEDDR